MAASFILSLLIPAVLSQTPRFTNQIPQVVGLKGDNVVLPCHIDGLGSHKVLWSQEQTLLMYDRRRIISDDRFEVERRHATDWSLRISEVQKKDAGIYSCQISTNPVTRHDVTLVVLDEKPTPSVPKEVLAITGSEVQITCKLPKANDIATWSYQSDYSRDSSRHIISQSTKFSLRQSSDLVNPVSTLVIKDVRSSDEGRYFCRVSGGDEAESVLKVVAPPAPPAINAEALSPNEIAVTWERPRGQGVDVVGYSLFVLDRDTRKETVVEVQPSQEESNEETHVLPDLTTDNEYTIQLAARLQLGTSAMMGQRSPTVTIRTPRFIPSAPSNVKVKRLTDDSAEVTWDLSDPNLPGRVRGYNVSVVPVAQGRQSLERQTIRVEDIQDNRRKARITGLTPKSRYVISVTGMTRKTTGQSSKPLVYLHKAFPPDLSLNARILSENSVLLTLSHVGSGSLTGAKIFYTEASEPSWERLDLSQNSSYTVVGGLDPRKTYFFKFEAKLGGKVKQSVTHATTPPYDLKAPKNVEVEATASTGIKVRWTYTKSSDTTAQPFGYIVYLEENTGGRNRNQLVVFNKTSVEVRDLTPGMHYNIMVAAFNGFGEGPATESIVFHIAESDVKQTEDNQPVPPSFAHPLPDSINITKGEPVRITCVANGYPVPEVTWFDNGEPIGVPAKGSNQLYIANMRSPSILTCRAFSLYGTIEGSTRVYISQDSQESPTGPVLKLFPEDVKATTLALAWTLTGIDPLTATRLHIEIKDKDDRTLLSRSLPGQTRSFNLHTLQPGTEYVAELRVFGGRGGREELLASERSFVKTLREDRESLVETTQAPSQNERDSFRARLPLTLTSVTPTTASLAWIIEGINPAYVQALEFKVKARSNLTLLTQSMEPAMRTMDLQSLTPGSIYYVQLRAFDARGEVLGQSVMQVNTPTETGGDGDDKTGDTTSRGLRLTMAANAVESSSARLDWRLSGSAAQDLRGFLLVIKDLNNRTLLRQEMAAESKSLSLSNLTPRTRYIAELYAVDSRGANLAQTVTVVTTTADSTDAADDTLPLKVYTEEVATDYVKVAWDIPNKLLPDVSNIAAELRNVANFTMLAHQMSALTRSLTVRNLEAGERYSVRVEVKGHQGQLLKTGYLEFDAQALPGMPGRPRLLGARPVNSSAAQLDWRDTPSPSPLHGAEAITGYSVTFATVSPANQLTSGIYQVPIYGSAKFVVIPNLKPGERYMFQVAATSSTATGPRSAPMFVNLPRQ